MICVDAGRTGNSVTSIRTADTDKDIVVIRQVGCDVPFTFAAIHAADNYVDATNV